jgi:protein-S-isoprenylcysteine O-methyltransferase Ste14
MYPEDAPPFEHTRRNDAVNYEEPVSPTATDSNGGQAAVPGADTPGVIAPPPLIYLGALGVGLALNAAVGGGSLSRRVARPVGAGLIVAGAGLMGTFVRSFRRARTPVDPYSPSQAIVTDGPYRLTRNPGYLGMALTYAGIAIGANAPWALVPLPVTIAVIDRGVIAREERYLEQKFGAQYLDYKRSVRRWVVQMTRTPVAVAWPSGSRRSRATA